MNIPKPQKIRKCIIPVAGLGTRFLPATKAMPKEMLPIIDKPVIQYIVEEAVASGITDIILVTGASKRPIEDHFDIDSDLERWLEERGKKEMAEEIHRIGEMANFIYVRQKGPYGNGTPVMNCRDIIGDEPFAVIWGDDLFINPNGKPRLKQLIETYEEFGLPVMTAIPISDADTNKYGVISGTSINDKVIKVDHLVEKPGPDKAPSRMGVLGAYILTPDIFDALDKTDVGKDNELWLVDGITKLAADKGVYARLVEGSYYDTGSKFGWLKANIDFALSRADLAQDVVQYLKTII